MENLEEPAMFRGRPVITPGSLSELSLPPHRAFATVILGLHLQWSPRGRAFDLGDRGERARAYEAVLREGTMADISKIVDGNLLYDLWEDLVLPDAIRACWQVLIDEALTPPPGPPLT